VNIHIELQSYLEEYAPGESRRFDYETSDGATVADVLARLKIPVDLASVISVNGNAGTPETPLSQGDRLIVVPPIAGG
jgi:sulfur carrier protein ThiS